jgi:hypothetical protein
MPYPGKRASQSSYFKSLPEVIRLVNLMYVRLSLSLRNVENLRFERRLTSTMKRCSFGETGSGQCLKGSCGVSG